MGIYTIYKFTNKKNGKSYIGKTNNLKRRIEEHKSASNNGEDCYFYRAVRKYGFDAFKIEILFQSNSKLISEKEFTNTFENLLIKEHKSHHTENGYNMTWGGDGHSSETLRDLVKRGIHPFQKRKDGTSLASDMVENGTHHFLKRDDGNSIGKESANKRLKEGTHNLQKRVDGASLMSDLSAKGKNPFSKRTDGSSLSSDRVKNGTHNWLKRTDGSSNGKEISQERTKNGENIFSSNVACYDKDGNFHFIPKQEYDLQKLIKEKDRKYVSVGSKEGKLRIGIFESKKSNMVICVNNNGTTTRLLKDEYHKQKKHNLEDTEWVSVSSTEGKNRLGMKEIKTSKNMCTCINKYGLVKNISTKEYHKQKIGLTENWEWVMCTSTEGKKRKI